MNVGYYSIDNTETNCDLPETDFSTTYNVIERFKPVLTNPKDSKDVDWKSISNVVVDASGNTYNLLKSDVNNSSYLKIIIIGYDGKLLVQKDIDNTFKKINTTNRNLIYLMGNNRDTIAVIVNDDGQLYRYYYSIKSNENNAGLELSEISDDLISRDSKDNHYNIDTETIPFDPRISIHGSNLYALIKPSNDESLNSNFPCLMDLRVDNQKVTEKCTPVRNNNVIQYLPSLQARNEETKDDARFDFGSDYNVFSSPVDKIVYDPISMAYLGSGIKMQRFDWSSPNYFYATDDSIGLYNRSKDPLTSSITWKIPSNNLPANYNSGNTDFVAYSNKEKHLFVCVNENQQGENGHIVIVDTENKTIHEDTNVQCSKNSVVLLNNKNFISSTQNGINHYSYDNDFKISKVRSYDIANGLKARSVDDENSSFVSSPVVYNNRIYANGNVFCNDVLSKDLVGFGNKINNGIQANEIEDEKSKGFSLKPVLIVVGIIALLAVLASLLLISKKKKNNISNQYETSERSLPKEEDILEDDDFDISLNVGVRNRSKYNSVHSISSKRTTDSHLSQKSLIKKIEQSSPGNRDSMNGSENTGTNNSEDYNIQVHDGDYHNLRKERSKDIINEMSPIAEEVKLTNKSSGLSYHTSNSGINDSSEYHDVNSRFFDSNDNQETYNNTQILNSKYIQHQDLGTSNITDNTTRILSPTQSSVNESTFINSDKLSPASKFPEESIDTIIPSPDVLYKNSKSPIVHSKNQNKISDTKVGMVQTKTIAAPIPQKVIVVNQMLANPFEETVIENVNEDSEKDVDAKSDKRKSWSYLTSLTNPFISKLKGSPKLKGSHTKNQNENSLEKIASESQLERHSNSVFSSKTVKPFEKERSSLGSQLNKDEINLEAQGDKVKRTSSIQSNSTTSTIKEDVNTKNKNDKGIVVPEFPEANVKNIYKKPLLGKQSKASLMSIDPLKIDLKKQPQINDISFDDVALPPPPSIKQKNILTSDNSSEVSFRTTKTSNSNYSERLNDIKQQYRQFQNNLHNQNKYSTESDQTSFISAASSSLDEIKTEDISFEHDSIVIPPFPGKNSININDIFIVPNRNNSKTSVRTGGTSYYSATSDMFEDKDSTRRIKNPQHYDPIHKNDIIAEKASSSVSYTDPSDNISVYSFRSAFPSNAPIHSPSRNRHALSSDSQSFYSVRKSTQITSPNISSRHSISSTSPSVSPYMGSPQTPSSNYQSGVYSPITNRESIKSVISFHSISDDGLMTTSPSISGHVTNPFMTNTSGLPNKYDGPLPISRNIYNDTSSFASATDSFHTVQSNASTMKKMKNGDENDISPPTSPSPFNPDTSFSSANESFHTITRNGSIPTVPSVPSHPNFTDASSFASAVDSLHTIKTSSGQVSRNEYDGPMPSMPLVQNFTDASSFASAAESFHTVKTTSGKTNGPAPLVQNFTDASSFASADDNFNTIKRSGPSVPVAQNFNDASSFVSAAESFHTIKTISGKTNEPASLVQNFTDASSFASAADSFNTIKRSGPSVPVAQNFNDASSFVSAAESFQTVKTTNTQATEATTSTFKTAKLKNNNKNNNYNPFKN